MEAGDQFAFGFGQVERGAIHAGRGTGEEDPGDDEREGIVEDEPVGKPAGLSG